MKRQSITSGKEFIEVDQFRTRCFGHKRVVGDDPHADSGGNVGNSLGDSTEAEQAQRRTVEFLSSALHGVAPILLTQPALMGRERLGYGEQQRDGVLRGRDRGPVWGVGDSDAATLGLDKIYRVDTNAGTGEHTQMRRTSHGLGTPSSSTDNNRNCFAEPIVAGAHQLMGISSSFNDRNSTKRTVDPDHRHHPNLGTSDESGQEAGDDQLRTETCLLLSVGVKHT